MATLRRLDDRSSLPAIRAFLAKGDVSEFGEASEIVAEWNVVDAVPELVPRLRDDNPHVQIAAAKALVELRAKAAIPAVAAAVRKSKGHWSQSDLASALARLRAP